MDSKHFRQISQPNPYISFDEVNVNKDRFSLPTATAPDNRYSEWPAIMADGHYTDYSPRCSKNVPVGEQFPTKYWLINNGEKIVDYSRKNQFPVTKALDKSVVPPPAQISECSTHSCKLLNTNMPNGIGVERISNTPELFGTFGGEDAIEKTMDSKLTETFEGGRNSRRGNQLLPY